MPDYPFPKPYLQQPGNIWVVKTKSGLKTFTDPELAWSAYYFSQLNYERHGSKQNGQEN